MKEKQVNLTKPIWHLLYKLGLAERFVSQEQFTIVGEMHIPIEIVYRYQLRWKSKDYKKTYRGLI